MGWICPCGASNKGDRESCRSCGQVAFHRPVIAMPEPGSSPPSSVGTVSHWPALMKWFLVALLVTVGAIASMMYFGTHPTGQVQAHPSFTGSDSKADGAATPRIVPQPKTEFQVRHVGPDGTPLTDSQERCLDRVRQYNHRLAPAWDRYRSDINAVLNLGWHGSISARPPPLIDEATCLVVE